LIKGGSLAGALVVAAAMFGTAGQAQAQASNCTTTLPNPALPGAFFNWGPAAICAGASAGSSISSAITTLDVAFLTQSTVFVSSPTNPRPDQMGGGVWIRGVGGEDRVKSSSNVTSVGNAGAILPGTLSVNSQERIGYGGVQGGLDIGRFNLGGSGGSVIVGLTGGVLTTRAVEQIGVGSTDFTVPFVGGYVAVIKDRFFADAQVRGNFYQANTSNSNVGLSNASFNGTGVTVAASAGYSIPIGTFFIEPSGGIIWTHATFDPVNTPGALLPFGVPPGTYTFTNQDSTIGRLGLRFGTVLQSSTVAWQPFISASVWDQFSKRSTSTFVCTGCTFSLVNDTSRIGTFGQFGIGTAAQILNTGWLGYIRGDYKTGENIRGWDITGGIRYQFPVGEAAAAPLITKARRMGS
jgi:hypothetical protein